MLPFPDEVPKNLQNTKNFEVLGKQRPEEWVFWSPPGKCKVLVENVLFLDTFDKHSIDKPGSQVPDSGFKFQDFAIARVSLVHSTARYKTIGQLRYLQCFVLGYGSFSKSSQGGSWGVTIYIYIFICIDILVLV